MNVRLAVRLALGLGVAARAAQYAAGTSLWHDEAFVALNIVGKSYAELFGPLDWHEPSPPGFLVAEKAVWALLGRSEYSLRLLPFVAGIAGLAAFGWLARRESAAWIWAVVLASASDDLVAQSGQVKHFTFDFLFAVLIAGEGRRLARGAAGPGDVIAWSLLGVVAPWFSYAAVFVYAGAYLVLAWRRSAPLAALVPVAVSWACLAPSIHAQRTGAVTGFWRERFPDAGDPAELAVWLPRAVLGLCDYFWQPFGAIVLGLVLVGGVRMRRQDPLGLAILAVPLALALGASFIAFWPFGGNQHMTFAAPAVFLLAAAGLEAARAWFRPRMAILVVAAVLVPNVARAGFHLARPRLRHEVRPVLEFVERNRRPGDQLLVFCVAEYLFYAGADVRGLSHEPDPARRVWFVSARREGKPFPMQRLLEALERKRKRLLAREEHGAAAYLFAPRN